MTIKRHVAVVAPVAGFLLGFLDFVWIKYVPYPVADLGNSLAPWAVFAFLLTYFQRWRLPTAILGGVVSLVVAVPSYYTAAALIQNDDWNNLFSATSFAWMGFGVVAGVVFGAAGVLARSPGPLRLPASGVPTAVWIAEAVIEANRIGQPETNTGEQLGYVVVLLVPALLTALLLPRTWRERGIALAWAVPLAAIGWVLLSFAGFR